MLICKNCKNNEKGNCSKEFETTDVSGKTIKYKMDISNLHPQFECGGYEPLISKFFLNDGYHKQYM